MIDDARAAEIDIAEQARRLRRLAAETDDLRYFRAAEVLEAPRRADALGEEIAAIRAACAASNIGISVMGTVSECDAARLVERSKRTLEKWRYSGCGIPAVMSGTRARYSIREIALWRLRQK
jgi:hypothetical protein